MLTTVHQVAHLIIFYIPPHCVFVCALHVALAYGLSAIIHFLYLWSNGGGEVGAQKVYQYHWSVFRYDTETSPSWQQRSHHTVQLTSCVAARCRGQVNKVSIHTLHTIHPHTHCSAWDHRHLKGCRHVDMNSQGGEFLHTLSVIRSYLIQCHMLDMMKHFPNKTRFFFFVFPRWLPRDYFAKNTKIKWQNKKIWIIIIDQNSY